jgi:hypothetical protein
VKALLVRQERDIGAFYSRCLNEIGILGATHPAPVIPNCPGPGPAKPFPRNALCRIPGLGAPESGLTTGGVTIPEGVTVPVPVDDGGAMGPPTPPMGPPMGPPGPPTGRMLLGPGPGGGSTCAGAQ